MDVHAAACAGPFTERPSASPVCVPRQVIIRQREATEGELEDKARKMRRLMGQGDDE